MTRRTNVWLFSVGMGCFVYALTQETFLSVGLGLALAGILAD